MGNYVYSLIPLLLICASEVLADKRQFTGYAYTLEGDELRYTESHTQTLEDGRVIDWKVVYRNTAGETIARKTITPADRPAIPEYTLRMLTNGYEEGIRYSNNGSVTMFRTPQDDVAESTYTLQPKDMACADSGFDAYVRQNWQSLIEGETVHFQFLVAGGLKAYNFRAKRIEDSEFNGTPVAKIKVSLDSLLGIFVDPLILLYDIQDPVLREYRGLGNIHDENGEVFPVRISYFMSHPKQARNTRHFKSIEQATTFSDTRATE